MIYFFEPFLLHDKFCMDQKLFHLYLYIEDKLVVQKKSLAVI